MSTIRRINRAKFTPKFTGKRKTLLDRIWRKLNSLVRGTPKAR